MSDTLCPKNFIKRDLNISTRKETIKGGDPLERPGGHLSLGFKSRIDVSERAKQEPRLSKVSRMLRTHTLAKICNVYKHTQANICDAQKDYEGETLWNSLGSILR